MGKLTPEELVDFARVLARAGKVDDATVCLRQAARMIEQEVGATPEVADFSKQVEEAVRTHETSSKRNPRLQALPRNTWMYEEPDLTSQMDQMNPADGPLPMLAEQSAPGHSSAQ